MNCRDNIKQHNFKNYLENKEKAREHYRCLKLAGNNFLDEDLGKYEAQKQASKILGFEVDE